MSDGAACQKDGATARSVIFNTEVERLIHKLWEVCLLSVNNYIFTADDISVVIKLLRRVYRLFADEPTVLDLEGPIVVVGGIHGHSETLLTQMSMFRPPPTERFLYLGNLAGQGHTVIEVLLIVFAMKLRYPDHIHVIRGSFDNATIMTANKFIESLEMRKALTTGIVWTLIERVLSVLPWAATIDESTAFCVHGGIGPTLQRYGVKRLRKCRRPATSQLEIALQTEIQFAAYFHDQSPRREAESKGKAEWHDGSPLFDDADLLKFLKRNKFDLLVRSRQLVYPGVLNWPPRMFTVFSAAHFLDCFRNAAGFLVLDGKNQRGIVCRFIIAEEEQKAYEELKPATGRNTLTIEATRTVYEVQQLYIKQQENMKLQQQQKQLQQQRLDQATPPTSS